MYYRRCVIGDVLCDNPGKSRANCASLIQWGIREGCIGWIPSSGEPAPLKRGAWGGYWLNNYQFTIIKWHKAQYVRSTNAKRLILNPEPLTFTYLLPRIHTAFIYPLSLPSRPDSYRELSGFIGIPQRGKASSNGSYCSIIKAGKEPGNCFNVNSRHIFIADMLLVR